MEFSSYFGRTNHDAAYYNNRKIIGPNSGNIWLFTVEKPRGKGPPKTWRGPDPSGFSGGLAGFGFVVLGVANPLTNRCNDYLVKKSAFLHAINTEYSTANNCQRHQSERPPHPSGEGRVMGPLKLQLMGWSISLRHRNRALKSRVEDFCFFFFLCFVSPCKNCS